MSTVTLTTSYVDRTAVVRLEGRLTLSAELYRLKARLDAVLAEKSSRSVILDMKGVSDLDSSGLGELVAIHTSLMRRAIRVAFIRMNSHITEILEITRVDGLLSVFPDEESALEHLAQAQVPDQAQE